MGTDDHPAQSRPAGRRPALEVLSAAILFGTTGTAASQAPAAATPASIGAARIVVGGLGLLAVLPLIGGDRRRASALWLTRWGFVAGTMTALYQLAFFVGVERAGVALATLLTIGSGPILVGILSWVIVGERPARVWWLSTAICILGLVLLTLDGSERPGVDIGGLAFSAVSAFGYASYTVAAKRLMNGGAASVDVMASAFGLGGLLLLPVLVLSSPGWLVVPGGLAVALWLGIATIAVAYVLFGRGLKQLPAGPVATLVLAEPLVATLLGVVLLNERPGLQSWIGAGLVVIGLIVQGVSVGRGSSEETVSAR